MESVTRKEIEIAGTTEGFQIRALSWKQPFANLMLKGKIETRTWNTKYRGWVLICASKKEYTNNQLDSICGQEQIERIYRMSPMELLNGKAIAVGKLVDCRPMRREDADKCFVEYHPNLYCHIYEHVRAIEPFDYKGGQGWRKLSIGEFLQINFKKITC